MVRLQKFLADAGVASRRASEEILLAGRVEVNGKVVRQLGVKIDPAADRVSVDGTPLKSKKKIYLAVHKPRGFVCTRQDELGRRTVLELLPREWGHLYPVGRLDRESEGLIFVTNDGDFALRLTHPRYGVRKKYVATVTGRVEREMLARFTQGVEHEGETLKAEKTRLVDVNNSHSIVELELAEGRNREVRRLFESQGLEVERLQRRQIGPIKLGELPAGKWRTLTETEIKSLLPAV
ncbi:MAG: rRNA pseudouridine synthase [Verrucomicrobia bacterium]|nr:rRNA pseudouridine synthase [Verrucomicrobiota bacterium]